MNLKAITRTFGKIGLSVKKYSPELLLSLGLATSVGAVVMSIKQTKKLDKNLEEPRQNLELLHDNAGVFEKSEYRKELAVGYGKLTLAYGKTYWPVITTEIVSIGCVLASYKIIKSRNVALLAAYKALDESYRRYRARVRETYGDEVDYQFHNDIKTETIGTGKKKEEVLAYEPGGSEYAKFFDASCKDWKDNAEYNYAFLTGQQQWANDLLKSRADKYGTGHLFLNEVYDMLGIKHTQAGAVVGWVYPNGKDNYVDFGIYRNDPNDPTDPGRRFVNGLENTILLDFNVDGVIYDQI